MLVDERVVAYASEFAGRAEAFVHPVFTGRGIGSTLLRWTEEHARARGATQVGQTLREADTGARRLLEGHGYTVRWDSWIFEYDLAGPVPEAAPAAGLELRTLHAGDHRRLYDLIDGAFSDWPDRDASLPFDDWRAAHLDRHDTDAGLVWLLEDGGHLAGAAVCLVRGDEGWVDQLAVERSHRGRGLGRVLLHVAFREFQRRGLTAAYLSTESRTGARGFYERVGMVVTRSFRRYTRSLDRDHRGGSRLWAP